MLKRFTSIRAVMLCAVVAGTFTYAVTNVTAQRHEDWEWTPGAQRLTQINPGTFVTVRTSESIRSDRGDARVYRGVVSEDVWDDYRRLAVPAIPRGSRAELVVRTARDGDLILDLEAIYAHGQRYAVDAVPERLEGENRRDGGDAAKYVGGGAILGTIIGSIAGGGKGAAIGAATGAAAGAGGFAFRGRSIRVPAGSQLTFRLEEGLTLATGRGHAPGAGRDRRDR